MLSFCDYLIWLLGWLAFLLVVKKILCILTTGWCTSNTCLIGKTALVTGGNAGIGYETALALAGRGARVIIADICDATISKSKIIETTGNKNIVTKHLDLGSLDSIRRFAEEINKEEDRLDVLVNNAGIGGADDAVTKDGLQKQMAVNYFGPFLLTHLLVDLLKNTSSSRIVFVSSHLSFFNNVTPSTMNEVTKFNSEILNMIFTYGNSKVCLLIASKYFAQKLRPHGITSNALHPGIVYTNIYESVKTEKLFRRCVYAYLRWYAKTSLEGAQTQIHCCLANELKDTTGKYFMDCRKFFQPPKTYNDKFCNEIIRKSEEYVKLTSREKLN